MTSSPPPPPPPPGYQTVPTRNEARWSRQAARQQRRTAALQAKQQQALLRAQMRTLRRPSTVGPVLLVALGVFFLLLELGRVQIGTALHWMAHWWPLLLVGAGVLLLLEWLMDSRTAAQRNTPLPRRTLGGAGTLLLVLIAAGGLAESAANHSSDWARRTFNGDLPQAWGLDQLFSEHSETAEDLDAPFTRGGTLRIENYRGSITLTGTSQDGKVHVSAHQRIWAWQNTELQSRQKRDKPTLEHDGAELVLRVPGEGRDETDLTIEVPHEAAVQIGGERGEVSVSELRGPVTISDHHGNVNLTALTGDIHITNRDDNADITGHSLSGNILVEGRSGDLSFSDITGPVTLHGDFFGTTHLERVQGAVHFQSSYTDLTAAGIKGELNVEGRSDLNASDLEGPITLSTSDRNLNLSGVRGSVEIRNRNGSVTLSAIDPLGAVDVRNAHGSIEVQLPPKSGFQVNAETADGDIENEFGLTTQKQGDRVSLVERVLDGGPTMHLQTTEGDVKIRKAGSGTSDGSDQD